MTDEDVIVDSWTNGAHAVLRDDSEFGGDRSPSGDREAHPSHTQQAVVRAAGKDNCAAQQATFRTPAGQISQAEVPQWGVGRDLQHKRGG